MDPFYVSQPNGLKSFLYEYFGVENSYLSNVQ